MVTKNIRNKIRSSKMKSNKKRLGKRRKTLKKGGYFSVPIGYSEFMEKLYGITDEEYAINVRRKLLHKRNNAFFSAIVASIAVKNKNDHPFGYSNLQMIAAQGEVIVNEFKKILERADNKKHIYKDKDNDYPLATMGAYQVAYYYTPAFKTDSPKFVNSIMRVIAEKNKIDMPRTIDHYKYQEYLLRNLLLAVAQWPLEELAQIGVKDAAMSVVNIISRLIGKVGEHISTNVEGIHKLKEQFEKKIIITQTDINRKEGSMLGDTPLLRKDHSPSVPASVPASVPDSASVPASVPDSASLPDSTAQAIPLPGNTASLTKKTSTPHYTDEDL